MVYRTLKSRQNGSAHLIAIAIVVLVVVGGIGAYVATGGLKKTVTATTNPEIKALLADAKAGKYDAKCTYENDNTSSDAILKATGTGTLYVKGADKMRLDVTVSGKASHFLRQGDSVYIWSDGKDKGSKLPITTSSDSSRKLADNAEKYQMKCQSDSLADSLFTLPSGVTFTDINSQLKSQTYESN